MQVHFPVNTRIVNLCVYISKLILSVYLTYVGVVVYFNQSAYSVDESGVLYPVLALSNPSLTDITVQVFSTNRSATGEYHIGL